MKETVCTTVGLVGGAVAALLGGWDAAMATLLIFMAVDFINGLICAAMGRSGKTNNGGISSKVSWHGLAKKVCVLMLIIVAVRVDVLLGTSYVRDAVCIAFCTNELISIVENAGTMGVPLPAILINALELLKKKSGEANKEENNNGNSET